MQEARVKAIAVGGDSRLEQLPNVPTAHRACQLPVTRSNFQLFRDGSSGQDTRSDHREACRRHSDPPAGLPDVLARKVGGKMA